ncbi:4'-phosphopantetheinyl transferase family protein [Catenulispora pinisilvae]|uniref:4'-phosphopantetheinyl transferase family protein n=1 Tax=Catenulispora pinisilvae TaxID=2705253 RepID=UPI0018914DC6|nr:4'-phosphopantetheinyl transferase superfamily protein [Catenulispora pinisilvae]
MIEAIVPPEAAAIEAFGDPPGPELFPELSPDLFPEEEAQIRDAVDKRRREFATVRRCAREALAQFGVPPVPILSGAKREPLWPAGFVGSMTHCDGYRAAVVARAGELASIGIDAEPHLPLPAGVLKVVAGAGESAMVSELAERFPEVHWDRLLFSAKESIYKAWFPLARCWLGFEDAVVGFDPASDVFTAQLSKAGLVRDGAPLTRLTGRWIVHDGLLATSVSLRDTSGTPSP